MDNLKVLEIQKELEKIKYPTPLATAKEILEFDNKNYRSILKRIAKNEPWEYIRGWTKFKNNKIYINSDVLIPRVETEELVDLVEKKLRKFKKPLQIFDIGTGSGCIAISLAKIFPKTKIYAIDISEKALIIAKRNIKENACKNITVVNTNLLNFNFDTEMPTVIVANLPYVPKKDIEKLNDSVKKHEPILALDGGKTGFECYERLMNEIVEKKVNLEFAVFEIDEVIEKNFLNFKILQDCFGRVRFVVILPTQLG